MGRNAVPAALALILISLAKSVDACFSVLPTPGTSWNVTTPCTLLQNVTSVLGSIPLGRVFISAKVTVAGPATNFTLVADSIYINATGSVDGTGAGWGAGSGPGGRLCVAGTQPSAGSYAGCGSQLLPCNTTGVGRPYGNWLSPSDPGSGGSTSCYCGTSIGGAGGAAINITANYAEVNGSIIADGTAGTTVNCASGYVGGGGSGGSILLSLGRLGYSTGTLRANGGTGAQNTNAIAQHGAGGSGGRIAVLAASHSYASDAWSDWAPLTLLASGGITYGMPTTAGAAGTIYLDAGTRNRTLLVDNAGATNRIGSLLLIPDSLASGAASGIAFSLRELRAIRGGHLRLLTPTTGGPGVSLMVGVGKITGDSTGMVSLANRTTLAVAANVSSFASEVYSVDALAAASLVATTMAPGSPITVAWFRTYSLDPLATVSAGILTEAGSTLLCPGSLVVNGATIDISGSVGGLSALTLNYGGRYYLRSIGTVVGASGMGNGGPIVNMTSITVNSGGTLSLEAPYTYNVTNVTVSNAASVNLGTEALQKGALLSSYVSMAGPLTMNIVIATAFTINATWFEITGATVTANHYFTLGASYAALTGVYMSSNIAMNIAVTAGPSPFSGGGRLPGDLVLRNMNGMMTGEPSTQTTITADGTVTLSTTTTFTWYLFGVHVLRATNVYVGANVIVDGSQGGYTSIVMGPGTNPTCSSGVPPGGAHAGCGSGTVNCSLSTVVGGTGVGGWYGSAFRPITMGSSGTAQCACSYGGYGGAAVQINGTGSVAVNGSIIMDGGVANTGAACATYLAGSGAGGSIWINAGTFQYSTGMLRANGGQGTRNPANSFHGAAGAGGRIAITAAQHGFASDAWFDWSALTLQAMGGSAYGNASIAGAPGTIYIDAGSRNRTLWLDAGLFSRVNSPPAFVPDPASTITLREIRLTNGAHVKFPAPTLPLANLVVSVSRLSSDGTGQLRMDNRTALVLGTASSVLPGPGGNAPDVIQTDVTLTLQRTLTSPAALTYTTVKQFSLIDATAPGAGISGELGSTVIVPSSLSVNYSTIDINGTFSGGNGAVVLTGGAKFLLRSTATMLSSPGINSSIALGSFSVGAGCTLSLEPQYAFSLGNITAVSAAALALGSTARPNNPSFSMDYLSAVASGALTIGSNVALNATAINITGGVLTFGTSVTLRGANVVLGSAGTGSSAGAGLSIAAAAVPAASVPAWAQTLGIPLSGTIALRSLGVLATGNGSSLTADDSVTLTGPLTWAMNGALRISASNVSIGTGVTIDGTGGGFTSSALGPGTATNCISGGVVQPIGGAHAGCGGNSPNCTLLGAAPNGAYGVAYGSVFAPTAFGSAGQKHCTCATAIGGAPGGGAIFINAITLAVNGSLIVDGGTNAAITCSSLYAPGAGAGGSIWLNASTLLYSTGSLSANGGQGIRNTGTGTQHGAGGSGGRIAITALRHSFASDAWADWAPLRLSAAGGVPYPYTGMTDAGAAGTIYVDAGSRNRTLWLDNGDPSRMQSIRYTLVPDQAAAIGLREIRLTRGAHLRWLSPINAPARMMVSSSALTGDATGLMSLANGTGFTLGSSMAPALTDVTQADASLVASQVPAIPTVWSVTNTRTYSTIGVGSVQAGITADAGTTLLLPPDLSINSTLGFDIGGAFACPSTLTLLTASQWSVRSSASRAGLVGPAATNYTMASLYVGANAYFSMRAATGLALSNIAAPGGGATLYLSSPVLAVDTLTAADATQVTLNAALINGTTFTLTGASTLAITDIAVMTYDSVLVSGSSNVAIGSNVAITASSLLNITGALSFTAGDALSLASPRMALANIVSGSIGNWMSLSGLSLEVAASTLSSGNSPSLSFAAINFTGNRMLSFGAPLNVSVSAIPTASLPAWATSSPARYMGLNGTFLVNAGGMPGIYGGSANMSSGNTTVLATGNIALLGAANWTFIGPTNLTTSANFTLDAPFTLDGTAGGYTGTGNGTVPGIGPGTPTYCQPNNGYGGGFHAGCNDASCPITGQGRAYGSFLYPSALGSAGAASCSCPGGTSWAAYGAPGGASIYIGATNAALGGNVIADGGTPGITSVCGTYAMGAGGSGGSIWISVQTLTNSSGLLRANGGVGGTDSVNSRYSPGGSGGRIAVHCARHSFVGDTWSDWLLRTEAQGGAWPSSPNYAGPAGTIFINCGSKNGSLLVDNGVSTRFTSPRNTMLVDQVAAITLRELSLTRAGVLRVVSPTNTSASQALILGTLTGDTTGILRLSARTMLLMSSPSLPPLSSQIMTTDFLPVTTLSPLQFLQSNTFSVSYQRQYTVPTSFVSYVGIQTDFKSTAVLPPAMTFVASPLDVAGAISPISTLAMQGGGAAFIFRSTATFLGGPTAYNGTFNYIKNLTLSTGSCTIEGGPLAFDILNGSANSAVTFGSTAAVPNPTIYALTLTLTRVRCTRTIGWPASHGSPGAWHRTSASGAPGWTTQAALTLYPTEV